MFGVLDMIVADESFLAKFPRLLHFLKTDLPRVADNEKVLNAYIMSAATSGGRRPIKPPVTKDDPRLANYRLHALMSLRIGGGPSVLVMKLMPTFDPRTKQVKEADAETNPGGNATTFNKRLIQGLEAFSNRDNAIQALEMVALHELTHWLHARAVRNPKEEATEVGFAFEEMAYSPSDLQNRRAVIDLAYKMSAN